MSDKERPHRGIFSIPVTPFLDSGELDIAGLKEVVAFCIAAGAHGLVAPVNASEFSVLSDTERYQVVETVSRVNDGRLPFVAGVSGISTEAALSFVQHAVDQGADAVIAMPPYVLKPHLDRVRTYYEQLAKVTDRPIFVQNYPLPVGVPMSPSFLNQLVREVPHAWYIKEEIVPVTHSVSADIVACGDAVEGVFGGAAGRFLMAELRRGAAGTMPACDVTDVFVTIWNTWEAGDKLGARAVFQRLLPLLNFQSLYGVNAFKAVLKRRGVIRSDFVRVSQMKELDAMDREELNAILDDLSDLFVV